MFGALWAGVELYSAWSIGRGFSPPQPRNTVLHFGSGCGFQSGGWDIIVQTEDGGYGEPHALLFEGFCEGAVFRFLVD